MNPHTLTLEAFRGAVSTEGVDPPKQSEVDAIARQCCEGAGIYVGGGYGRLIPALIQAGVRFSCILEPHEENYRALVSRFPDLSILKQEIADYDGPEAPWSLLPYGTFNMFPFEEQLALIHTMLEHSKKAVVDIMAEPYYTKQEIDRYETTSGTVTGYYAPIKKYKKWADENGWVFSATKYIFTYTERKILWWIVKVPTYHWIVTFSRS